MSVLSLDLVRFSMNCVNEVFSLDQSATFLIFFGLLQRCFERLKRTMKDRTPKRVARLYSFRVTFTLKLMVAFLGFCSQRRADFQLVSEIAFPLVELLLSLLELYPHLRYWPLFLHYCGMLLDVQQHLGLRVPVARRVFALLRPRAVLAAPPGAKDIRGFDFEVQLRAGKEALGSRFFWTEVVRQAAALLAREVRACAHRGALTRVRRRLRGDRRAEPAPAAQAGPLRRAPGNPAEAAPPGAPGRAPGRLDAPR